MSGPELKSRPFCGGAAFIRREPSPDDCGGSFVYVQCNGCRSRARETYFSRGNDCPQTYQSARGAWNTRAPVDYAALPEVQEADTAEAQRRQLLAWCDARQADVMGCLELTAQEEATAIGWIDNFRAAIRKRGEG